MLIFSRGRICNNLSFIYDDKSIEIVNDLMYLIVLFAKTGSFVKATIMYHSYVRCFEELETT